MKVSAFCLLAALATSLIASFGRAMAAPLSEEAVLDRWAHLPAFTPEVAPTVETLASYYRHQEPEFRDGLTTALACAKLENTNSYERLLFELLRASSRKSLRDWSGSREALNKVLYSSLTNAPTDATARDCFRFKRGFRD